MLCGLIYLISVRRAISCYYQSNVKLMFKPKCLTKNIKPKVTLQTQIFYINIKDKINKLMKSYVVYQFFCSGCNWKYIGKIKRNLCLRLKGHATEKGSSVFNHTSDSAKYQYIKNLHCVENKSFDAHTYDNNYIQENTNIIDSASNWTPLLKKEELHIKLKKPILNRPFWGCSRMIWGKKTPHTFYNNEIWHIYTLPKEDPKTM